MLTSSSCLSKTFITLTSEPRSLSMEEEILPNRISFGLRVDFGKQGLRDDGAYTHSSGPSSCPGDTPG